MAVGCAVLGYIAAAVATVVATRVLGWAPMQSGKIGAIAGNLPMLLGLLAIAWSTAAFGEELLFRGFLLGRLRALLGGGPGFGIVAAFVQALLFGLAHAYQGPTGILVTGLIGLVFGLLYLRLRVLWPLVIAHGLIDTVGLLALYAGVVPR
ncbi:CPBP family intramembrane glutamic endopeptidase [Tahibacter sp. UC22_41]|uniref:CPBP family intramembrane glutamic endopeptidase n=1 Tax=Tahibacter sp. UC22_41 TaxID=3350178 RepID=UPI0036DAFF8B